MQFTKLTWLALFLRTALSEDIIKDGKLINEQIVENNNIIINNAPEGDGQFVGNEKMATDSNIPTANFNITYNLLDRDDYEENKFLSVDMDETILLNYTFVNHENYNVSVIGVSGEIISQETGQQVSKISFGELDDLFAQKNETLNFIQKVKFNIAAGQYFLFPMVHTVNETAKLDETVEEVKPTTVAVNPTLINMQEPLMSIFNPQFLSIQVMFLAVVGFFSYRYMNKMENEKTEKQKPVNPKDWLPEQYRK